MRRAPQVAIPVVTEPIEALTKGSVEGTSERNSCLPVPGGTRLGAPIARYPRRAVTVPDRFRVWELWAEVRGPLDAKGLFA